MFEIFDEIQKDFEKFLEKSEEFKEKMERITNDR